MISCFLLVLPASCCFRLWFRGLSPCLSPFLSFLSLLKNGGCSIMISRFLLVPALVPGLFSLLVSLLVPSFFSRKGVLFHHDVLVPLGSGSGAGACLPSSLFFPFSGNGVCSIMVLVPPGSGSGSGACLPSAFFLLSSGMISLFFLVPAGVPVLVSLLLSFFFSSEKGSVPS